MKGKPTGKLTAWDSTPGERMIGGYRCGTCGAICCDRRAPGDRGSYPARNRSRAALIKHWNKYHWTPPAGE
jgi:hypothetical protein